MARKAESKLLKNKRTVPKPGKHGKRKSKHLSKAANGRREAQVVYPRGSSHKNHMEYYKPRSEWQKDLNEDTRYKNQAASKKRTAKKTTRKKATTRKRTTAKAPSLSSIKSTAGAVKYLKAKGYTVSKRKKK